MKYWLNLALSALALGAVISAGVIAPVSGPTPAFAVDEAAAPVITQAATNGSLWAGSDAAGEPLLVRGQWFHLERRKSFTHQERSEFPYLEWKFFLGHFVF